MKKGLALGTVGLALLVVFVMGRSRPDPATPAPPPTLERPQNVLLITLDTLRADRVGAYGYAPARTPNLDSLARTGVRFDDATAPAAHR